MEVPITGTLDQGIFKRSKTEEEHLAEKKLCLSPKRDSVVSQDLFASCVPYNDHSPDPAKKMEEVETPSPDKTPEEDTLVPTLEDDQDDHDVEEYCHDKSILKSPVTPEPNFLENEDSMGFDHLQALNIITPCLESTQSFMSILRKKVSPIQRKCFRDDITPEPLNSTQTFFDISRHYKLISNERKKMLYGDPSADEENVNVNQSVVKPLRRKLFDDKEEVIEAKSAKQGGDDYVLESFEEEWKNVTVLKPSFQKQISSNNICKTPDMSSVSEQCSVNKDSDKTHSVVNEPESLFKTPDNRKTFQLVKNAQIDVSEISVPAMVVEETVSTECEDEESVTEVMTKTEEMDVVEAVIENSVVADSENEMSEVLEENMPETPGCQALVANKTTHMAHDVNRVQPVSVQSVDHITLTHCHNIETKEEEKKEPSVNGTSDISDAQCVETRRDDVESNLVTSQSCKRVICPTKEFNPDNRIYKKPRLESENKKSINCPELVQELFRETGLPAVGFPSYPPEISKVVPIPIPDEPIKKRNGLSRRKTRLPLHPYISRNTVSVNEE